MADANGDWWGVQDAAPLRVDTGSLRAKQAKQAQQAKPRPRQPEARLLQHAERLRWHPRAGAAHCCQPGGGSDISLKDGGDGRAAYGPRDTPGAINGIPTIVFPAGVNDRGQPINLLLLGRAWADTLLPGMAYAFEPSANAAGRGHYAPQSAPPLHNSPLLPVSR